MNSFASPQIFNGPMLMWNKFAWSAGEMAVSSLRVIGHRMGRLMLPGTASAGAGDSLSDNNRRELNRMGQEKGEAALESAQALGSSMLMLNQQLSTLAFKQIFSVSMAMMSIASSRTAALSADRQAKLIHDTMSDSVVAASKLSGSTARLARSVIRPASKRVKANVRRLGKR